MGQAHRDKKGTVLRQARSAAGPKEGRRRRLLRKLREARAGAIGGREEVVGKSVGYCSTHCDAEATLMRQAASEKKLGPR